MKELTNGDVTTATPTIPMGPGATDKPRFETIDSPEYDNLLSCIRCGLCLSVCPTYFTDGIETQSPRGRVALIRAWQEGRLDLTENLRNHLYHCLDCRACQTVCPNSVRVGEQVLLARTTAEEQYNASWLEKLIKKVALDMLLPNPNLLEAMMWPMRLYEGLGIQWLVRKLGIMRLFPKPLAKMEGILPPIPGKPLRRELAEVTPAIGERRYRVGFFLGCIMTTMLADSSRAAVEVLTANGCEVVYPRDQVCCGAPHAEEGEFEAVRSLARRNLDLFSSYELDYIVADCAACSAEIKEYGHLMREDEQYAAKAREFSSRVRDINEFLAGIELRQPLGRFEHSVAYHHPCHQVHAQGVREAPRSLLKMVPGLSFVELNEADWCCGSAGVYNITHVDRGEKVLQRKMDNVEQCGAEILTTGNPGCLLQLKAGVRERKLPVQVLHPMEVLAKSYIGGIGELRPAMIPMIQR